MPNTLQGWQHLPQPHDQKAQTLENKFQATSQKAAYTEIIPFPASALNTA